MENKMTSNLDQNHDMCSSFKENKKTLSRESVKQDTKENQVIDRKGKSTLSTRRGKILGMVCGKERDGVGVQTWVLTTTTCDP
jgi:hypothetical protein